MLPGFELSARMRMVCTVSKWASVAIGVMLLLILIQTDVISEITGQAWASLTPQTQAAIQLDEAKRSQVNSFALIGYFAPMLILFGAFRMFRALEAGAVFSIRTVKALRFLGLMVLLFVFVGLFLFDGFMGMTYLASFFVPQLAPSALYEEAFTTLHQNKRLPS